MLKKNNIFVGVVERMRLKSLISLSVLTVTVIFVLFFFSQIQ